VGGQVSLSTHRRGVCLLLLRVVKLTPYPHFGFGTSRQGRSFIRPFCQQQSEDRVDHGSPQIFVLSRHTGFSDQTQNPHSITLKPRGCSTQVLIHCLVRATFHTRGGDAFSSLAKLFRLSYNPGTRHAEASCVAVERLPPAYQCSFKKRLPQRTPVSVLLKAGDGILHSRTPSVLYSLAWLVPFGPCPTLCSRFSIFRLVRKKFSRSFFRSPCDTTEVTQFDFTLQEKKKQRLKKFFLRRCSAQKIISVK
jgi:hypothetical protein